MVKQVLDAGADLSMRFASHCADNEQVETARLLISRGARVDAYGGDGKTPLHRAAEIGSGRFVWHRAVHCAATL